MENNEKEVIEEKRESEKQSPFLKRFNELEKKMREFQDQVFQLSQKIEIVIKSLRR